MSSMNVVIKPEIISWALQSIQFENVASSAIELLNKWQSGEKTPTFNQVEDISKKTNIPFGYFFLDKPPVDDCPIVDYRTVDSLSVIEPSRNLIDTVDQMTDIQNWMKDYAAENGQDEIDYVGCMSVSDNVAEIVESIRNALGLDKEWYLNSSDAADSFRIFRTRLNAIGVLVMMNGIVGNNTRRKLNIEEFRAFTLVNKHAPLIFINSCDSDSGKLFSILHETAHIWLGVDSFYNERISCDSGETSTEQICNAVAAELLVPGDAFIAKWKEVISDKTEKIDIISKYFKCSNFVIARKAFDTGKITRKAYEEIVETLTKQYREWKDKQDKASGGDYYRTLGSKIDHRLVFALASSASEGRTQYTDVYRLTNTNRKTFAKLLSDIEGAAW